MGALRIIDYLFSHKTGDRDMACERHIQASRVDYYLRRLVLNP